jgi:hypothetical protein
MFLRLICLGRVDSKIPEKKKIKERDERRNRKAWKQRKG